MVVQGIVVRGVGSFTSKMTFSGDLPGPVPSCVLGSLEEHSPLLAEPLRTAQLNLSPLGSRVYLATRILMQPNATLLTQEQRT